MVIETESLTKRFRRRTALNDCSLSIPRGRVVALVGPNGSGKTTLLRLLAGLSKPTEGRISVFGEEMSTSNTDLRARVGYLDQDRPLYERWRVREILEFGRRTNPAWDSAFAAHHLALLDIDVESPVRNLSGGSELRSRSRSASPSDQTWCCSTNRPLHWIRWLVRICSRTSPNCLPTTRPAS